MCMYVLVARASSLCKRRRFFFFCRSFFPFWHRVHGVTFLSTFNYTYPFRPQLKGQKDLLFLRDPSVRPPACSFAAAQRVITVMPKKVKSGFACLLACLLARSGGCIQKKKTHEEWECNVSLGLFKRENKRPNVRYELG